MTAQDLKNLNQCYQDASSGRIFRVWEEGDIDIHNRGHEGTPKYILRCIIWNALDASACPLKFGLITAGNYKKHLERHWKKDPNLKRICEREHGLHLRCYKLRFCMGMSNLYEWYESVHILSRVRKSYAQRKEEEDRADKLQKLNDKTARKYFRGFFPVWCICFFIL